MKSLKLLGVAVVIGLAIGSNPDTTKAQIIDEERGSLGLGFLLGEPTGVSVKSWNSSRSAFDIGAAWSLAGREGEALHLHADFLLHSWFSDPDNLALYYGLGGRIIFADEAAVGARVPVGLNYVFSNVPFDMFVEAAPILDLTPEIELAGNGAIGIRYYF